MKYLLLATVAISLFCVTTAVIQTYYKDTTCTSVDTVGPASGGVANPTLAPLNVCTKYFNGASYKFTSCTSNGKAAGTEYSDSACATKIADFNYDTDKCSSTTPESSNKITCSPASSATIALAAVAAAALLLFV
jgi:hypothetical protein